MESRPWWWADTKRGEKIRDEIFKRVNKDDLYQITYLPDDLFCCMEEQLYSEARGWA